MSSQDKTTQCTGFTHSLELQRPTAQAGRQKKFRQPTRPAGDVVRMTKGLQERTQLIEWDDGET